MGWAVLDFLRYMGRDDSAPALGHPVAKIFEIFWRVVTVYLAVWAALSLVRLMGYWSDR